jgi:hypothetical protein
MAILYTRQSNLTPEEALQEAIHFFGPSGIGLQVKSYEEHDVRLEGQRGHVFVHITRQGVGCDIEIETYEWERDVQRFLEGI